MTADVFEWVSFETDAEDDHPAAETESILIENDDAPDELAIVPDTDDIEDICAAWITATGDSFVDLEGWR